LAVAFRTRDASVSGCGAYDDDSDVDESLWTMVSLVFSSITDMDTYVGRRWLTLSLDELTLNGEGRDRTRFTSLEKSHPTHANPTESVYAMPFSCLPSNIFYIFPSYAYRHSCSIKSSLIVFRQTLVQR
jgi:hypothetical protein